MADMLAEGAAWLAETQREHVSRTVIYRRASVSREVAALVVTVGNTDFEQHNGEGIVLVVQAADWIASVSDLVFDDGTAFEPQRGDVVVDESIAGKRLTYEVRSPGQEPVWRYADRHRQQARMHSALVKTETT